MICFEIFYRIGGNVSSDYVCARCDCHDYHGSSCSIPTPGGAIGARLIYARDLDPEYYDEDDEVRCDLCGHPFWTLLPAWEPDPDEDRRCV